MRRLRMWFWMRVYSAAAKLQNIALVRRSQACGCMTCTHVAHMFKAVQKAAQTAAVLRAQGDPRHDVTVN